MFSLIMIDWGGPRLSGEQALALQNIASIWLRGDYNDKVNFDHFLIEGKLTHRGRISLGAFSGSRFFADFGTHNDAPWYSEFILPAQCERIDFDKSVQMTYLHIRNDEIVDSVLINSAESRASPDNLL